MPSDKKIYDLTASITESTVVYPGDPAYESKNICSLENGNHFHLCEMKLSNHMGTHIDYPAHTIKGGKTSSDYPLSHLMGEGTIIEIPDSEKNITIKSIDNAPIFKNDIVFFKTANSRISKQETFTEQYVSLSLDAAKWLIGQGVKIIGIDYMSVDAAHEAFLPVHHELLANDVLIVEGLELANVTPGRCQITIAPLKIEKMDGLPARVFCVK